MMEKEPFEEDGMEKAAGGRKKLFVLICIASVIVAVGIFILLFNGYVNKKYTGYEVLKTIDRPEDATQSYIHQNGHLIRYSKDGISELDENGENIWTGSYDMSNPVVSMCGEYTLVADIGGKEAYIYNGKDTGTEISVDYEIRQAQVSKQGLIALALQDTASDMIAIYNPYDVSAKLLVEIPTNVEDGYPVSMALSPDGTSVVAAYLCINEGKAESRVAFYNFSDVGKNTDCLVGAQNYADTVMADIRFLDNSRVCMFSDTGFYLWKNMKQPQQVAKVKVKKQIKSIFSDAENIGLVLENTSGKESCQMQIYNTEGRKTTDFTFYDTYDQITLEQQEILMTSSSQCCIYRLNGVRRFAAKIEGGISAFFKASGRNRYYVVTDASIQKIKLKNE